MIGENTWLKITTALKSNPIEIATVPSNNKEPLWFKAYIKTQKPQ